MDNPRKIIIIKLTFSPTNGRDQVKASMKLDSQYGCGEALNCLKVLEVFGTLNEPYINCIAFVLHNRSFVVIHVQVIRRRKYCHQTEH